MLAELRNPIEWHGVAERRRAAEQYKLEGLDKRSEDLRKLAAIVFDENEPDERREGASNEIVRISDCYVEDSLRALGFADFQSLAIRAYQRMALHQAAAQHLRNEEPSETVKVIEAYPTNPERALFLSNIVWPKLLEDIISDTKLAERCGHSIESWSKLSLNDWDREYSRMKKREQTAI